MSRKRIIWITAVISILLIGYFWIGGSAVGTEKDLIIDVKKGDFEITVTTSGELEAKKSINIKGPTALQQAGIWETKISKLVPEGTVVQQGDFIASLDPSGLVDKIKIEENNLLKSESQFITAQLDTTLQLREARDQLVNLEYSLQEADLKLKQSIYEPPAAIRQIEIEKEKAQRTLEQAKENYLIKKKQAAAKMQEALANLNQTKNKLEFMQSIMNDMTIFATDPGMVIYSREWNGKKKTEGSLVRSWDPTVATLPDLTTMISRTYVNEVDIRNIQVDQVVRIGLDAYPAKKLSGKVTSVANVGEQRPNSEAKVFEVIIEIADADTTLRPAMTTSNTIVIDLVKNALYVPLEAIQTNGDSLAISYVFVSTGTSYKKQEVILGKANENEIIIEEGLKEGDRVYLSVPNKSEKKEIERLSKASASIN